MEQEDNYPPDHPAYSADDYGDYVDRDVIGEDEVRQEEKDHSKDRIDDEYRQLVRTSSYIGSLVCLEPLDR